MKRLHIFALLLIIMAASFMLFACDNSEDKNKITITYYLADEEAPETTNAYKGKPFKLYDVPERSHYTFLGLFDEQGGKIIDENGECTVSLTESITLYAHWAPHTYTIKFETDEGATFNGSTESFEASYGNEFLTQFPFSEKTGYDFIGWFNGDNQVSKGDTFIEGANIFTEKHYDIVSGTVTLSARYEIKQLDVMFEYNDGINQQKSIKVQYGQAIPANEIPKLDTGSKMIVGWTHLPNSNLIFEGAITEDITLFPIWKNYSVAELYENSVSTSSSEKIKILEGETVTLKTPEKIGYTFDGWYTSTNFNGNPVSMNYSSSTDVKLYAKWIAITYTVTVVGIDVNTLEDKRDSKGNPAYNTKDYETLYYTYGDNDSERGFYLDGDLTNKLPKYLFAGHCTNDQNKTYFTFGGLYSSLISDNGHSYASYKKASCVLNAKIDVVDSSVFGNDATEITLYALIVPITYNVSFNVNNPSYGITYTNGGAASIDVAYNENLSLYDVIMPTNTYYKAKYCYNDVEYYGFDGKGKDNIYLTENITLTAYWGVDKDINDTTYHAKAYADVYYIKNAADLNKIRNYPSKNYILIDDVLLSGQWTPISTFSGTLNGNGKSIKNISIQHYEKSGISTDKNIGLFANVTSNAKIYDLNVYDSSIYWNPQHDGDGWVNAGIVAGSGNGEFSNIKLYNCSVIVHRDQSRYGGVVGVLLSGEITNCHSYGIAIDGNGDSGGIVGVIRKDGAVSNCTIDVSPLRRNSINHYANTNTRSIGGICGFNDYGSITNCIVKSADFLLSGGLHLRSNIGKIVGHQKGGCIHYVDCMDSTNDWDGDMYKDNGFLGIGNFDYRTHWFAVGWGYAGAISENPSIK